MYLQIRKNFFSIAPIVLIILCYSVVFGLQKHIDKTPKKTPIFSDISYLPNGTFLKGLALSYDEALADLLWIKAIGFFGSQGVIDKKNEKLHVLINIVTTLDPLFQYPYEFAGIVFSDDSKTVDRSIEILEKGIANVPHKDRRYWYLPFFMAYNYMHHKEDYLMAAKYLEIAASFPQSPPYLPLLVSRLYANSQDPELALPFLQEMLASADTPERIAELDKRIKDIKIKQHISVFNTAIKKFHEYTGRYPTDLKELVGANILKSLPIEPYGGEYKIIKKGIVQSTSDVDDLNLHLDKKTQETDQPLIFLEEPK
ncbi:hypothetical protein [Desulforhopalus sp. IMCC35007]|uniref:hypothetical protein n=1 Tax=Desulforhopalus sp. IMCC35007 TaxID=2569543 RepID=UPI0010ADAEC3|nr:hypothetical protein [Desulforhopalus sp. IMCC35007]TKB09385.1 hypothetical protein FCL48_10540 [Desulforhopalus sp. IMCC35007]